MSKKKTYRTVSVSEDQYYQLQRIRQQNGISIIFQVRCALMAWIERNPKKPLIMSSLNERLKETTFTQGCGGGLTAPPTQDREAEK